MSKKFNKKVISIESPSERKARELEVLKVRLLAVKKRLPSGWQSTFFFLWPEYKEYKSLVYNVGNERTWDDAVITHMEELADKLEK